MYKNSRGKWRIKRSQSYHKTFCQNFLSK
jgi:hypothetical protein